jgi:hypothetical protein
MKLQVLEEYLNIPNRLHFMMSDVSSNLRRNIVFIFLSSTKCRILYYFTVNKVILRVCNAEAVQ